MGTASARLLASGALRRDRLDALSLLGILVDHADAEGSVRMPFDTLVGEFGVAPERGRELLEALLTVDVVRATQGDGMAVGGAPPEHSGAFRLSAFLANVTVVLEDGEDIDPSLRMAPRPVSSPSRGGPGRAPRSAAGTLSRVLVGAVAAMVTMWSMASPSSEPTAVRTVAAPSSSSGRAPWATTPTTPGGPGTPALIGDDPTPSAPTPDEEVSPAGSVARARDGFEDPDATSSGPASPTRRSPTADAGPPRPSSPPPSPPTGTVTPPQNTGTTCPVGGIESDVVDTRFLSTVVPGLLDVVAIPGLEVQGILRNRSDADLVVRSFEVGLIGNPLVVAAGAPVPMALPAGGAANWSVVLPTAINVPSLSLLEVRNLDWTWTDPVLDATCTS